MFGFPGWAEVLVIAFVGLLVFGKRLPDVARSLGKSVVEFKKGVRDITTDVDTASRKDDSPRMLEQRAPHGGADSVSNATPRSETTPEQTVRQVE